MLEVVVNIESLRRSASGNVTGEIHLHWSGGDFPERGWSDFPVVILEWWISGLTSVVERRQASFQGLFMDGPFAFVVTAGSGTSGAISWGKRDEETAVGTQDLLEFRRTTAFAALQVVDACQGRGWTGADLDKLRAAIACSAA